MRELLAASSLLGLHRVVALAMGLARVKVAALVLGSAGVGILSQVLSLKAVLGEVVGLGIGGGVTKYVAEYSSGGDTPALQRVLDTVTTGFMVTAITVLAGCIVFAPWLAELILADRSLGLLIILVGIAIPLTTQLEIVQRVLQGLLLVRQLAFLGIVGAVAGFAIAVPLMIWGGVAGAVLAVAVGTLVPLGVGQYYLQRVVWRTWRIRPRLFRVHLPTAMALLRFGGARSASVLLGLGILLVIRATLIERFGAAANGLYQVAWAASNQYLGIIGASVWSYAMPKIATVIGDRAHVERIQNDALRFSLLVLVPAVILLLAFRTTWIPLLYSGAFLGAYALIGWQLAGDFIRTVRWSANLTTMPRERFRFILLEAGGFAAVQLVAFFALLPRLDLIAAPLSYAIGHAAMLPITLLWHWRVEGLVFQSRNRRLMLTGAAALATVILSTRNPEAGFLMMFVVPLLVLGTWLAVSVSRDEMNAGTRVLMRAPAVLRRPDRSNSGVP